MPTDDELDEAGYRLRQTLERMLLLANEYLDPPFGPRVTDDIERRQGDE